MLSNHGSSASDRRWTGRMWLRPVPPPGPLTFTLAWATQGVPETTVGVDAAQPAKAGLGRASCGQMIGRDLRSPHQRAAAE
jgi:hypothetical protein